MADALAHGRYLAGDSFSNAECAVIPYILRLELLKLDRLWAEYPAVSEWWARMRARPSVNASIFGPHDGEGLGAVQESRARSVAQGAGAASSGVNRSSDRGHAAEGLPLAAIAPCPACEGHAARARPSRSVITELPREPKY